MSAKARPGEKLDQIEIASCASLRSWLTKNHRRKMSVWCVTWKKAAGPNHVPYADIVEEALCFGWIDSLPRTLDAGKSMLLLSPRKPDSNWSKLNKERAERMIALGQMTPAGQALIDVAKSNGKWSFLDDVDALIEPADLKSSLKRTASAKANWDRFPPSAKRGILEWIKNAKTAETRARRVEETAKQAGKNIRANQYRQNVPGKSGARSENPGEKTAKSGP